MLGVGKEFHRDFSGENKENEKKEFFGIRKECLIGQTQTNSFPVASVP